MNPWAATRTSSNDGSASQAAPYQVSIGGLKAFSSRHRLHDKSGLCVAATEYSSVQLLDKLERLARLKTSALERVRELEQAEALITSAGVLLPHQLDSKLKAVQSLRADLEELLVMKSVLLRTLQKNVASEYLDLEMEHQRAFIDLFLRLSDELPRYASGTVAANRNRGNMAQEVRQRHKDYETAVSQCKATIAKFHLIHDNMARIRAAYSQLQQATLSSAFAG